MSRLYQTLCFFILFISCNSLPTEEPSYQKITKNNKFDGYWLKLPLGFNNEKQWPVIIFLQGGHGFSPNPENSKNDGPIKFSNADIKESLKIVADSFIIVNPHMKIGPIEKSHWQQYPEEISNLINHIVKEYNGDSQRIYITGLSKGGHGSWELAKKLPGVFAAIIPISGRIYCENNCVEISKIPIWIIHNQKDEVADYSYSKNKVAKLEEQNNISFLRKSNCKLNTKEIQSDYIFTSYPKNGHDAWNESYASKDLYMWLLNKKSDNND
ncbi:carboxylesterase family protein [Marinigracilibium pacificum]|uniref:Phospholipase/carboxylesterase/thioesterase domain-containing protein n=1 Tax=Marinigracilibium pacificum TaxID=2729599 RepID=A0A848IX89_9BACT|nr:PHB depolymerase family esterase [Marinigracilibium pacificum]NMM47778.1 hypothetical protein [Marinigracilibium pacificum]